ncbi:hypothetical protein [Nocardia sp. NPDC051570]|uniref:hypothetical protein n=1 Tax=Nocardia sp. NPDC051570 TaxID=3364324 RepID=UPI00378BD397
MPTSTLRHDGASAGPPAGHVWVGLDGFVVRSSDPQQVQTRRDGPAQHHVAADAGATPRLTNHDGLPWHIDFHTPASTAWRHIAAEAAAALTGEFGDPVCSADRVPVTKSR